MNPSWLLVAINKIDLYPDTILEARDRYYSTNTAFTARIKKLSDQVGSDNFNWYVLPVCAKLDDFSFGSTSYKSQLREGERDFFIDQFTKTLVKFCNAL